MTTQTAEPGAILGTGGDVLNDLDFPLVCTSSRQCNEKAEWLLTFSCCKRQSFLCSEHLLQWVRLERMAINGHAVACRHCGKTIETFEDFAHWRQL